MSTLKPWAHGPFELIVHAEMHFRNGGDFDRRIALIGYDNAIEVAIHTYLNLNPIQRRNRQYRNADVEAWLQNYHTKIDFFLKEVADRSETERCDKAELIWYHDVRNGQYHVGGATIPQSRELGGIRAAACWVFGLLFDVPDVEELLQQHLSVGSSDGLPQRTDYQDKLIDDEFGVVKVAGRMFYSSELLHSVDAVLYSELANDLAQRDQSVAAREDAL